MMVITQKITSLAFEIHDGESVSAAEGLILRTAVYLWCVCVSDRNGSERGAPDSRTEDFSHTVCFLGFEAGFFFLESDCGPDLAIGVCVQADAEPSGVFQLQLQLHGDPGWSYVLLQ